jgi:LuxR family transcriptional regulator, maltose regulon positive regulatory protein
MTVPEITRLISTKFFPPRFDSASTVRRQRLVRRLSDFPTAKLFLFCAPAGSGKTTLVQEWLSQENHPLAWVTLDQRDNDIVLFWRYLTTALSKVGVLDGAEVSGLLTIQPTPPIEEIINLLINDLVSANSGRSSPVYLVLDDYQVIENPLIHAGLTHLLDYQPDFLRLVIATRSDPPLNLARLRARRALLEIRAADLRFTPSEAEELLTEVLGLAIDRQDAVLLCQRTEGWAAGLQLAAISLREVEDPGQFVSHFAGDDRYIADYLVGEVLQRRDPDTQRFLLETALLERFNAELCAAVTGRQDCQNLLARLETENIFLISLDHRREWYRYHRLFADLLFERLLELSEPDQVAGLYRKACRWHIQQGEIESGVEYALKSRDYELVVNILLENGSIFFTGSQLTRLVGLAVQIPRIWQEKSPRFLMMMSWALLATGEYAAVEPNLQAIERAVGIENQSIPPFGSDASARMDPQQLAALIEIAVVRANPVISSFDLQNALEWGQTALPYLDHPGQAGLYNTPRDLKGPLQFLIGLIYKYQGVTQDASRLFKAAAEDARHTKNNHILALATANLAELQILDGQLKSAEMTCLQGLNQLESQSPQSSPYAGGIENQLGKLDYERNDLSSAVFHFQKGCAAGKLWRHWDTLIEGCAGLVAVRTARSDLPGAQQIVTDLFAFIEQNGGVMMRPAADAIQARIDLVTGNDTNFLYWVSQTGLEQLDKIPYLVESWFLLYLHFLVRKKHWQKAAEKNLLLMEQIEDSGRQQVILQLLIDQAIVEAGRGDQTLARLTMSRALALGESLGYFRIFLDAGSQSGSLVYACFEAGQAGIFAARLLEAFSAHQAPANTPQQLPGHTPAEHYEPLTSRELEVLTLLAEGLTNQEICARLTISLATVKTHTRNLYAKLGVDNRARAVAVARYLGILTS